MRPGLSKKNMKKMSRRPDFLWNKMHRLMKQNAPQARIFDKVLMGTLSYSYSVWFIFYKSQLKIFFF